MTKLKQTTKPTISTLSFTPGMCLDTSTNTPDTLSLNDNQTPTHSAPPTIFAGRNRHRVKPRLPASTPFN